MLKSCFPAEFPRDFFCLFTIRDYAGFLVEKEGIRRYNITIKL